LRLVGIAGTRSDLTCFVCNLSANSHLERYAPGGFFFGTGVANKQGTMVRLTVVSQSSEEVVLKVEGWVDEESVALLEEEGERWLGEAERLVLDLDGVKHIDPAGLALLRRWSGERLVLRGGAMFMQQLLKTHGLI